MDSRGYAKNLTFGLLTTCFIGLGLSYYSYIVEIAMEKDEKYEAMCDISEHVSCSKAFMSKYGKGFGLIPKDSQFYAPNCIYGIGFYALVASLSIFDNYTSCVSVVLLGITSNLTSIYLAYILYLLKNLCVVCVGTYIVNAVICILAVKKYHCIHGRRKKAHKKQ